MNDIADQVVTDGIRQYEKFKIAAQEAIERCKKAEEETSFFKGQFEAIQQQCQNLEARNKALMEENAEFKMLVSDLGRRFLEIVNNSKLSPFRPAGKNNSHKARLDTSSPPDPGIENNLQRLEREIAAQVSARKD